MKTKSNLYKNKMPKSTQTKKYCHKCKEHTHDPRECEDFCRKKKAIEYEKIKAEKIKQKIEEINRRNKKSYCVACQEKGHRENDPKLCFYFINNFKGAKFL